MRSASERDTPRKPVRPSVPLTVHVLAVAMATARMVLRLRPGWAMVAGAVAVAGLAALLAVRSWPGEGDIGPMVGACWVALAVVAGLGCGRLCAMDSLSAALGESAVSSWTFVTEGDMSEGALGYRVRARAAGGGGASGDVWLVAPERLEAGTALRCVGRFEANDQSDWGTSSRMQGVAGTVHVTRVTNAAQVGGVRGVLWGLRAAVVDSLGPASSDGRAILAGAVCGSRVAMADRGLDVLFSACGLSHLVAVSGSHLAIVAAVVAALLSMTGASVGRRSVALVVTSGLFVLFCGAPDSAVRAWLMAVAAQCSTFVGRRAHPLSAVGAVGTAMVVWDPTVTGRLGFVLSVISVTGLTLFGSYARYALGAVVPMRGGPRIVRVAGERACDLASVTCVTQAVTLPVAAAAFGRVSLVAPLANVLGSLPFLALVWVGLGAACLAWVPPAQAPLLACADILGALLVGILRALVRLPGATVPVAVDAGWGLVAVAVASVALLRHWPDVKGVRARRVMAVVLTAILAVALRWRLFAPARIVVMDVGQGDAVLVTDGAAAILVDAGPDEAVSAALARNHVTHLDAVVLTHMHDDHVGGLESLVGQVSVERVLVAQGVADALPDGVSRVAGLLTPLPVGEVSYGDRLVVGGFDLRVVWPRASSDGSANEDSLVLLATFERGDERLTALLAGDAESGQTGECVASGDVGDVDLLKVGHHGSEASLTAGELQALLPEVSVASAGEGNRYGHPTAECRDLLEGAGSLFLCTMDVGDVTVEPGLAGPKVRVDRGSGVVAKCDG